MINDGASPCRVEIDPRTGVKKSYYEISDGVFACKTETPVDDLFAANHAASVEAPRYWGDLARVASIPMNLFMRDYMPAMKQHDTKHIAKLLNDSDNAKFRTRGGKI